MAILAYLGLHSVDLQHIRACCWFFGDHAKAHCLSAFFHQKSNLQRITDYRISLSEYRIVNVAAFSWRRECFRRRSSCGHYCAMRRGVRFQKEPNKCGRGHFTTSVLFTCVLIIDNKLLLRWAKANKDIFFLNHLVAITYFRPLET